MTLSVRSAVRTHRGLVRGHNEDSAYAGPRLLAVADGVGGAVAGELASATVIAAIAPLDTAEPDDLEAALRAAVHRATDRLQAAIEEDPTLQGMGTTLTALLLVDDRLGMAHIADSRGYLLRDGEFAQITRDETLVQTLIEEGRLTREEARRHPYRSVILRSLTGEEVEPVLTVREPLAGDRYLLCSDGLTDYAEPEAIAEAIADSDPDEVADRLVELALTGGGGDNITVIVADIVTGPPADTPPVVAGAAAELQLPDPAAGTVDAADAVDAPPELAEPEPEPGGQAAQATGIATATAVGPKRRHTRRNVVIGVVALVVLAGAAFGGWRWTQTQYFVAAHNGNVAVYQGINTQVAGFHFYHSIQASDYTVQDLVPAVRSQVRGGIDADDRDKAMSLLAGIIGNQLLPPCPAAKSAPAGSSAPASSSAPATSPTPVRSSAPSESAVPISTPDPTSNAASSAAPNSAADSVPGTSCR